MKGRIVICDYCGTPADFVDSSVVYHGHSFGMIYLCPRCGAYVGVHKANNLASTLDELKERGVWLFGAEADGTVGLYDAPFDRPTAIINQANASVLSQVLMALHDAGMSIPQDVSVLSCGTYFEGEPTRFPITEMPVMPEELCAEAMNLLVSAIEEHTDIKGSVELIEPALKRRGSVAEAGSGGTI